MLPNLFKYATSELSQDAFLCWFLSWLDPKYSVTEPLLNRISNNFINLILGLSYHYGYTNHSIPMQINSVEIQKQKANIDILCIINGDTPILIEDKTGTQQHSDQLSRYKELLVQMGFQIKKAIFVYIQTGDQSNYREIVQNNYCLVKRQHLLEIFESEAGKQACLKSDILRDFARYLQEIEEDVQSYANKPLKDWYKNSNLWRGFYSALQYRFLDGEWDYVPNPSGGFLGFWWHQVFDGKCIQYLQLEEDKLCFKIDVEKHEERAELRNFWYDKIKEKSQNFGLTIKRPKRFGNGQYMTVAILDQEYRVVNCNQILDIEETIKILNESAKLLDACYE